MAKIVDKKQKQAQLLQAAIEVFARKGYQTTTMDDVAAEAKVSKGSLYLYFKNKEVLFNEVFLWFGDMIRDQIDRALAGTDNEVEKLQRMAVVWGEVVSTKGHYASLFLDFWAVASSKGMRHDYTQNLSNIYVDYRKLVIDIINAGKHKGLFKADTDARVIAYLLVGAMDGMFLQCWLSQPRDVKKIMTVSIDTVINGIVAG